MKMIIEIKENPGGDIEVDARCEYPIDTTQMEKAYARRIIALLKEALPKINKALGGDGVIDLTGDPRNS